ncbi:hypothetical protein Vretimale_15487 [Volvox reticuliferus]|uniref:SCP domain-containing protein n=1 Tax=Volvox reticuliferus TaxID=1737510 RepID=A0A8J4GP39_9CHLO|nr:hypothetical protein Vretifemale_20461 [Volvox reticuliferus]GIM12037.1 hypothetical protein Vretimale_15487 [Volvox reticuliferus]
MMFDESSSVTIIGRRMTCVSYFIVLSILLMNYRRTMAAEAPKLLFSRRPSPFPSKAMSVSTRPGPRKPSPRQPLPPPPPIKPLPSSLKPSLLLVSPVPPLPAVSRKHPSPNPSNAPDPKPPPVPPPSPPASHQFRFPTLPAKHTYRSPSAPRSVPPSASISTPRPLPRPLPSSASPFPPAVPGSKPSPSPPKTYSPNPGPFNRPPPLTSRSPSVRPPSSSPNQNPPCTRPRATAPLFRLPRPASPCPPAPSPPKRWSPLPPQPRPLPTRTNQPSLRLPSRFSPSPLSSSPPMPFSRPFSERPRSPPPPSSIHVLSRPTPPSSPPPPPPTSPRPPPTSPRPPPPSPPPSPLSNRAPPPAREPFVGSTLHQLPFPPTTAQPRAWPASMKDQPVQLPSRRRSPSSLPALPPTSAFSEDDVDSLPGGNCPDAPAVLDLTNTYRARHQAPPLTWNEQLARDSTAYAKVLAANNCQLRHMTYGENLMQETSYPKPDMSCLSAIQGWYSEVFMYDFNSRYPFTENWPRKTGHFSQLVWKSSSKVGCGAAVASLDVTLFGRVYAGGCKVIVCRYLEYGNVASDFDFIKNGEFFLRS